jgi:phosphoglycolate phosphatase
MNELGPAHDAADLLRSADAVLLDFDGPICSIFAGSPAPMVAARLRDLMAAAGINLPTRLYDEQDPLNVFRFAAALGPDMCEQVEKMLREAEVHAIRTAAPTPHAGEFMRAWQSTGRLLAVVSNNSHAAVEAYLTAHHLRTYVDGIAARTEPDPTLMKPSPHLVLHALRLLDGILQSAVLIGDSETDIASARVAGLPSIGYANKPGKRKRLASAGADAIVTTMDELVEDLATSYRHREA